MINPGIRTKVIHSKTKNAWNIVGKNINKKYKIARIPYLVCEDEKMNTRSKSEALKHANFINYCFNNSVEICKDRS